MLTWELGIKYINSSMDKKIIVDCDGVLLDWAYAFDVWMDLSMDFIGYLIQKNITLNLRDTEYQIYKQ